MKKILLCIAAVFSLFLFGGQKTEAAQLEGTKPISQVFPDPAFAQYIADQLKVDMDYEVSQEELSKIYSVSLNSKGITSIEGLQYLTSAATFSFRNNQISDLTPFSQWENLRTGSLYTLDLMQNPVTDLAPLANLDMNITKLIIRGISIDNSQIDNLLTISNKITNTFDFGGDVSPTQTGTIDDFTKLGGVFRNPGRTTGHARICEFIELGEFKVVQGESLTVYNPALGFDGSTIPVWAIKKDQSFESFNFYNNIPADTSIGTVSPDNKWVTINVDSDAIDKRTAFNVRVPKTDTNPEISIIYRLSYKVVVPSSVTVKYLDEQGEDLAEPEQVEGFVDEQYVTNAKDIPGYTLKEIPNNATGLFTEETQEVIYVYTKDPVPVAGGDVTVRYLGEDGEVLHDPIILNGNADEEYETEAKEFDGYTLKETPTNATGVFTEAPQEVIYVYTKDPVAEGSVIVKYEDEDGTEISDQTRLSGSIGEEYETKAKDIEGFRVIKTPENATGLYGEAEIEVIYVYRKISDQNGGDQDPKKGDEVKDDNTKDDNTPKTLDSSQTEKEESDQSPEIQNIPTKNASSTAGKSGVKADAEDRQTAKSSAKALPETGSQSPLLLSLLGGGLALVSGWFILRHKK